MFVILSWQLAVQDAFLSYFNRSFYAVGLIYIGPIHLILDFPPFGFSIAIFAMAMALDMPVDQVVPASVLQPHLPAPEHAIKAKEKATAVVSHRHSGDIGINCQEQETGHPTDIEDDEVQFVFSVPRRRRKKRKRYSRFYPGRARF